MYKEVNDFWEIRLKRVQQNLQENGFNCFLVQDCPEAKTLVLDEIFPGLNPASVSWGGSSTFKDSGLYYALKERSDIEILDTFKSRGQEGNLELRRQALLVDLFITGTNAITEQGYLANLDMIGNRVGALVFGPRKVLILCGRNKIVSDVEAAMDRIKTYSAPANALRLKKKTPCARTAYCHDCDSPDRICNVWSITVKSFPKGRINVILINEDLGL